MPDENEELYKRNYPGSDQAIPGTDKVSSEPEEQAKPIVHITDVLGETKANSGQPQNLRTYQSDVASTVQNDNVSVIKIALSEKKRQEKQGNLYAVLENIPESKKNTIKWIVISGLSIGVIITLVFFGFNFFKNKLTGLSSDDATRPYTVAPATSTSSKTGTSTNGFQVEVRSTVNVTGKSPNAIADLIKKERDKNIDLGAIREIQFVKGANDNGQKITSVEFMVAIQARAGEELIRALYPEFAFGIYSFKPRDAFLILYVDNYPTAYSGMLAWETYMNNDLKDIIVRPVLGGENVKTDNTFVDRVIQNRDARVLFDEDGNYKLIYTFLDQKTIVIAPNDRVLKEVLLRLTTGKIVR